MNSTTMIYQSIAFPALSMPVYILLDVFMSSCLLLHISMVFALFHIKLPSRLTKLLLFQQGILDGFYSGLIIAVICTQNFTPNSKTTPINPILCYIFQSGFFTFMVTVMGFCNIVCQSADRLWALVYPQTYQFYTKYYIGICSVTIPVYSVLATSTNIAKVTWSDGSCWRKVLPINKYLLTGIEIVVRFCIPMCILVFTNARVIRQLYRLRIITLWRSKSARVSVSNQASSVSGQCEYSSNSSSSLQNALFLNAFCLAIRQAIIESTTTILTVLNLSDVFRYDVGSIIRVYSMFAVVMLYSINPFVAILTIKPLRDTVTMKLTTIASVFVRRNVRSQL